MRTSPDEVSLRLTRPDDAGSLTAMLTGLSPTSSYFRFLTGGCPSDLLVTRLLHRDATHGAWLAVVSGAPVGHVMWSLVDDAAELGVVVADAWQQRGIGRWLIQAALAEAAVAGAVAVRADVHHENRRMIEMLRRTLPGARVTRDAELLTFLAPMRSAVPASEATAEGLQQSA